MPPGLGHTDGGASPVPLSRLGRTDGPEETVGYYYVYYWSPALLRVPPVNLLIFILRSTVAPPYSRIPSNHSGAVDNYNEEALRFASVVEVSITRDTYNSKPGSCVYIHS